MTAAQNAWNQILTTKRRRAKGDLSQLQGRLWYAITVVMIGLDAAMAEDDVDQVQKWLSNLTALSHAYCKVAIEGDLEQRLKALEAQMQEPKQ